MKIFILFFSLLFNFVKADTSNKWLGNWIAFDQWQSEFEIKLEENGRAFSTYADGDEGTWSLLDGNLVIKWKSGKKDYIFDGVMGKQRIHENKNKSYTSGIKKKLSN
ncbi:MAG: hypothetical protein CBE14_003165 [Rickettsiales bacterium TMED254]|nr:hypothetical protein [Rickettsiales bacterium]RPF75959.1 MAG: hypothetical protein CBE14_003165 [Rickettsiales bacterium TMED254]|tara:strand:- start:274 stop:594 length:321 start_codon:yes stop_codon:yes gene_type:complete